MRCKSIAFGLLAAALKMVAAESDVVSLTADTFKDFIATNDVVLAEFFAPWCGHCKALAPEYEIAATSLKEKGVRLAKVDCTEETSLCSSFGVEGYPTLKVFRGPDNVTPYSGQRKAPAITSYMIKQSLPAVSALTKDTVEDFKTSDNVVVVAYYDESDSASSATFKEVAEKLREKYLFGAVTDAEVAKTEEVEFPQIVVYKKFDEGRNVFTEKFDVEAIEKFTKTSSTPLIGEIGPETYSGYMSAGIPLAYIFADTPEERKEISEALKPVAKLYKGDINFAVIDSNQFGAHAGNLNLKTDVFPAFAIHDIEKNLKYPFEQGKALTHDDIAAHVKSFHEGSMKPSIKSEPIPETQEGDVKVVVAHTYEEVVHDDTKDVLIEFYAPWCGHCKALAPKYDELATKFAESAFKDKVVIAKVDATANDVPDEVQGFPTIKMYPAGDKKNPVTYSGARTVDDLIRFIKESGKYKADPEIKAEAEVEESASETKAAETSSAASESTESSSTAAAAESSEAAEENHDEL